ncbi:protoporphyrinogen/coproporphyrinogen oxidase [Desertivirga arenae]|uniref:protoporphyrinogen/coproporphyrinogen oxidase n=1 Tax=Desertivirga arenae TaxID=2810309 RepID=UPI001A95EF8C|nr:NAD(P)-binding protein [Pedobacter sp. SYSU D00823]
MRVGILGGGISGLSIARLLKENFSVEILESKSEAGGIARTRSVAGYTYHPVGGHCFNSKHRSVMEFVYEHVLKQEEWNIIKRNAGIKLHGKDLTYPIEYSVKEIAGYDPGLAASIIADFSTKKTTNDSKNLEEWFRQKFGDTLSELYFLPYNKKIWNMEPSEINPDWVEGKLPIPDRESFFRSLGKGEVDEMTHRYFLYPKTNNQNTFIDKLAEKLPIVYNYQVLSIEYDKNTNKWQVNGEKAYDLLVSTLPLNLLPSLISNTPEVIIDTAKKLKYNKVTTMLWTSEKTERTWTYIPDQHSIIHRYIHIGNYFSPRQNITITESIGTRTYEEMRIAGGQDPFLIKPLDFHVSNHAYVVFDKEYKEATKRLKDYFSRLGIHLLGRFGEWDYFNMDECINRSMNLAMKLKKGF